MDEKEKTILDELKIASKPLQEWIKKNSGYYSKAIVTIRDVEIFTLQGGAFFD